EAAGPYSAQNLLDGGLVGHQLGIEQRVHVIVVDHNA
nr:hypothetical protein [Tanacetum cinerariifolium]